MNAKKYKNDMILSLVLVAAAVFFYYIVIPAQIRIVRGSQNEVFSPDTFPKLLTILFIVCGAVNAVTRLVQYIRTVRTQGRINPDKEKLTAQKIYIAVIPFVMFLLSLVYIVLFKKIGFIAATALAIPAVLILLKCKKWHYYVIAYAFAALMYVLFKFVLQVPIH